MLRLRKCMISTEEQKLRPCIRKRKTNQESDMKKNQLGAVAFVASILVSGCGGGGGGDSTSNTATSSNSTNTAPSSNNTSNTSNTGTTSNTSNTNTSTPTVIVSKTFSLPQGQFPWFHDVTIGTNGEEV